MGTIKSVIRCEPLVMAFFVAVQQKKAKGFTFVQHLLLFSLISSIHSWRGVKSDLTKPIKIMFRKSFTCIFYRSVDSVLFRMLGNKSNIEIITNEAFHSILKVEYIHRCMFVIMRKENFESM